MTGPAGASRARSAASRLARAGRLLPLLACLAACARHAAPATPAPAPPAGKVAVPEAVAPPAPAGEVAVAPAPPAPPAPSIALAPPPPTRSEPVSEEFFGTPVADEYRWLEDASSPEARQWIEAQNAYTDAALGQLPWRAEVKGQLEALLKAPSVPVPKARNGRYFLARRPAGGNLPVLYLKQGAAAAEELLIDPHTLSEDLSTSAELMEISADGRMLAYAVRQAGADEVEVRFFDVDRRTDLPEALPRARYYGVSLTADATGAFYTRHGTDGGRLYFHRFGTEPAADPMIFGDGYSAEKYVSGSLSDDGRFLAIHVIYPSANRTEVHLKDLANGGPIRAVVADLEAKFYAGVAGDRLILQTNWQAPNGRILAAPIDNPAREAWQEIVPERSDASIDNVSTAGGKIFVKYLRSVQSEVLIFEPDGTKAGEISFGALGTVTTVSGRWERNEAFFSFHSFHVPPTVFRYDISRGAQEVWEHSAAPVDSSRYEILQAWYPSKDGTQVPMFIVHPKGLRLDGSHRLLLTAYGGFGASLTPFFSPEAVVWLNAGGIFALASIRGGGEFGAEWHHAGMREYKQNTFDDFIAAAEWLIEQGYTRPERLATTGSSNGGLTVAAAMVQRPDLFRAVVCSYPVLDMLRYHKFLAAQFWVPEFGSPESAEDFPFLYAYSPYHRVKSGVAYPAVLLVTGEHDTRVAPLHAAKMTAKLQAASGSGRPVLLRYLIGSGHAVGSRPLSAQIESLSEGLAFLLWQTE